MPVAKKRDLKKSCRKKVNPARLHEQLGRILLEEKARRSLDARDAADRRRIVPTSSQIPFLP